MKIWRVSIKESLFQTFCKLGLPTSVGAVWWLCGCSPTWKSLHSSTEELHSPGQFWRTAGMRGPLYAKGKFRDTDRRGFCAQPLTAFRRHTHSGRSARDSTWMGKCGHLRAGQGGLTSERACRTLSGESRLVGIYDNQVRFDTCRQLVLSCSEPWTWKFIILY